VLVLSCSAQALHAAEYDVNWDGTGDFTTIQAAIDAAVDGDLIIVHPGTYYENIHFDGKNITLRSLDPEDEAIVASTVIDGGQDGSVVTFEGTEGEVCLLSGFTITNGRAYQGGGISGTDPAMDPQLPAHASIANCVITRNTVAYTGGSSGGYGGGLYYCDGEISNCTITGNSAAGTGAAAGGGLAYCYGQISNCTISGNWADYGGGVSDCEGTVSNCTISGNWAHGGGGLQWCAGTISNCTISGNAAIGVYASGGGLDRCYGTISDCTISGNYAGEAGGGLYGCSAELINCRITSNSAPNGAGLSECSGEIRNCTISGNSASGIGGGLSYCDGPISFCTIIGNVADYDGGAFYFCTGTITNCTISGNSARWGGGLCHCGVTITNCTITQNSARELGGGLYGCYGTITGCIIWGNEAEQGRELHLCQSLVEYSCIRDRTVGEGNISDDPLFVKGPLGDYYLSCRAAGQDADSPCIDAGSDTAESLDLDKFTTRTDYVLDSGVVDMGYHYPLMLDQKPQIECSLNSSEFRPGDTLVGFIEAQNRGLDVAVDAYIAFVLPNGEIISLTASGLSMGTYPWVSNVVLPSGLHFGPTEVFRMMVPDCPGSYLFAAGLTEPGRSEFIGEPNLFPFTIRDFLLRVRIPERDCRR
jgi:hypothetical protein